MSIGSSAGRCSVRRPVVRVGQPIAKVSDRGESTDPHPRFGIEINGQSVDPIGFYAGKSVRLS